MGPILLVGAFGQGNPGDEALLEAFLGGLEGWSAVATSRNPARTRAEHRCGAVSSREPAAVARAVADAEAVVFAGGTIFKTLHAATGRPALDLLLKACLLAGQARLGRKPVALVGVGVGRLETGPARKLARGLVRMADLLVLRDEESAEELSRAAAPGPFRIGADPAWTVVADGGPPREPAGPVVVALSHLAGGPSLARYLADALWPVVELDTPLELQPWQVRDDGSPDLLLARRVAEQLDGRARVLRPPTDLRSARDLFARRRLVVGLRFHALVAAAAAGTPFVAGVHEAKLAGIARRFGQPAVPLTEGPVELARAILGAESIPPPSPDVVREEAAAAKEGFGLLRLLLRRETRYDAVDLDGLPLAPTSWLERR